MKKLLWLLIAAFVLVGAPGYAQDKSADMNMQILRDKLKADKKVLVAANMQLTDAEMNSANAATRIAIPSSGNSTLARKST